MAPAPARTVTGSAEPAVRAVQVERAPGTLKARVHPDA
jgi:hypothetical protein